MPLSPSQLTAVRADRILRNIRTLWYIRFPLLLLGSLILLAPMGLYLAPKFCSTALVASSTQQVATLVFICMIAATTAMIQTATILEIGSNWLRDKRIKKSLIFKTLSEISKPRGCEPPAPFWRWEVIPTLILLVAGLTLPITCALQSLENKADSAVSEWLTSDEPVASFPTTIYGFAIGLLTYYVILHAIAIIHSIFEDSQEHAKYFKHHPVSTISNLSLKGKFKAKDSIRTAFWKNHHEVFLWGIAILGVYLGVFWNTYTKTIDSEHAYSPAFYLVLILVIWETAFSVIAFYFDRYRIPAIIIFVSGLFFIQLALPYQHHFKTIPATEENTASFLKQSVAEYARDGNTKDCKETKESDYKIIVVAPGGGIHAAAWTGTVLAGLHERFGSKFEDSLYLISAVSGGSVGTMFYLDHFKPLVAYNTDDSASSKNSSSQKGEELLNDKYQKGFKSIRRRSSTSTLESLFWGLTYPDTVRFAFNRWITVDRGDVQESLWKVRLDSELNEVGPTLMEWHKDAAQGLMPYVIFNATETESGRRVLFSTHPELRSSKAEDNTDSQSKPKNFLELSNGKVDIPITTAVRLSATFPYISPASRPSPHAKINLGHIVDGGYADNDGLLSAIEVIDALNNDALNREKGCEKFILIRIEHVPESDHTSEVDDRTMQNSNGFKYASLGPIFAANNVRDSSQKERGEFELKLLRNRLNNKNDNPALYEVTLRFRENDNLVVPPLNWKLLPNQRTAYDASWKELLDEADEKAKPKDKRRKLAPISEGLYTLTNLLNDAPSPPRGGELESPQKK